MSKVRSIPIITKTTCDQHYGDFSNCGSGAFSIVLTAVRTSNNQRVAIKVINTASLTDNEQERLKREIQVNQMVVHPNIVQVYEIYQGAEDCCLVMEYMEGGDLFSRVVGPSDDVDEEEARRVTKMILEAVEYLHNHNIAHRDLKPENVVFDKKGDTSTAKLIDFGFAKILDNQNSVLQTPVGTLEYCAPEVSAQDTYSLAVDMWSVGCIVFFMLCKASPFSAKTASEVDRLASEAAFEFPDIPISEEAKSFVSNLLQLEPKERMSASEALNHEWFRKPLGASQRLKQEMNDEQKSQLRETINSMIDGKRGNPETLKKQRRIMNLIPAKKAPLWERRMSQHW
eukprot:TRINITY_DN6352_c0_g1_i2.p1 TRINITY_DN6352_c0_g1~~TRINITY_DN6352_c0_g1_i2.p1  ORF type:complete len:342 (-),score=64.75 TRINITY_DN6352_c0_g1_i2:126-1151(-)